MSAVLSAWLKLAFRRHRAAHGDLREARRRLVAELAPGKSFLDVGGMWNIHGDIAFWAEEAGATNVVICDGMDPTDEFLRKHAERGSGVRYAQRDLHDTEGMDELGRFDVVWCAGVIYHSPNPYLQLENLRRITNETLVLGTHTTPEVPGFPGACLWYPALEESHHRSFESVHRDTAVGASSPIDRTEGMGYVNFWWGLPPSAVRSMLDVARFRVERELPYNPTRVDFVARTVDAPSVIPPVDSARRRDVARHASFDATPAWAFAPHGDTAPAR